MRRPENAGKSAEIANRLAQIYLDDQVGIKFSATEYAVDWLSGRVSELESELKQKEDAIKNLRAETEMVSLTALEALNVRAKDIRERLAAAELSATVAQEKVDRLGLLAGIDDKDEIVGFLNDPSLNRLVAAAKRGDDGSSKAFDLRLGELLQSEEISAQRAEGQRAALRASYDRIQQQIGAQNADLATLNQLVREADAIRVLYETFLTRLKETSVQIGLQQADGRILSSAIPGILVSPRKTRFLTLAIILGSMLGAAFVLFRQFRHDGFRTAAELEKFTGQIVLGQIPKIAFRRRRRLVNYLQSRPASAASEAIRNMRTSVLMSQTSDPPKVIMLSSSIPDEGKTTQAIALAHNLSCLGKNVLLVEADIRRRAFRRYFRQASPGNLAAVVLGDTSIEAAVLHHATLGADVLMGNESAINAADLFSSGKFQTFVKAARSEYDFVIIDTPPVLVVPDARIIGRHVDAILFSVNWDRTRKSQVAEGLRQFSSVGVRVSGLVLSQIDRRRMKRYGYDDRFSAYSGYGRGYFEA